MRTCARNCSAHTTDLFSCWTYSKTANTGLLWPLLSLTPILKNVEDTASVGTEILPRLYLHSNIQDILSIVTCFSNGLFGPNSRMVPGFNAIGLMGTQLLLGAISITRLK